MAGNILLVDADPQVRHLVESACSDLSVAMTMVKTLDEAFQTIEASPPDVVLLDMGSPEGTGLTMLVQLRARWPRLCAVLIAERARSDQAIEAIKLGAIDYLLKPLRREDLIHHLTNALRISHDMTVPAIYESSDRDQPVDRIVGQSPAIHEVFKLIGLIAPRDVNVLITGESGTGKELVARAIYQHSRRKDRPFLAVNCAAIPETLLESELFGNEKGAYTGADVRRIGKFEQCNSGTLLLDEIGDLPLSTQAKLLRVLQDGTFQRLGGNETIHCDVRILASTNQPIEQMIAERRFRQDLFYRLKVASIHLPPLRDRDVDVVLLAHYFVRRFNPQIGSNVQKFSPEVISAFLNYPWPGNVRELENVIKASLVVARGSVFQIAFLPEPIRACSRAGTPPLSGPEPPAAAEARDTHLRELCSRLLDHRQFHGQLYERVVQAAEREVIRACLAHANGQLAPAARLLGITRTTLRKKMAELNIKVRRSVSE
ncbi:MAG: sigma-54-dependent transcriptional regulator [Phycisphaerae bacterium]